MDLAAAHGEIGAEIAPLLEATLRGGRYIGGEPVEAFESEFADLTGTGHCVSVGNGTEALYLALLALGVGAGDEVIVPSHTFVATWLAVCRTGAEPVPVEPDPATYLIDPGGVEAALSERTRAIVPVHLYGQPADLDALLDIARRHSLKVVEDAAQCHGACYRGRAIGGHGDAVAWSFYPTKNLGALGDAGAVTTNDPELAGTLRELANYGVRTIAGRTCWGLNSRLDTLQAALLRLKLKHLATWNARRVELAGRYLAGLEGLPVHLPGMVSGAESVWHQFVIRHPRRDALQQRLATAGVATMIHYPVPPHRQLSWRGPKDGQDPLPIASSLAGQVLSLPVAPPLSDDQADYVVDVLRRALDSAA